MNTITHESTGRIRRARVATFVGFATLGGMTYAWSTSVTAFREQLGLGGGAGDLRFGVIALGAGIAAAIGSLVMGSFADRFGPRGPIVVCVVMYPLALLGLGQVRSVDLAIAFVALLGLFRGALDTALNTHGIQVERHYRRSIMSSFHACYSLGGFFVGLVGSWMAGHYTTSATVQFSLTGLVMLLSGVGATFWMLRKDEILPVAAGELATSADRSGLQPPSRSSPVVIILFMIAFGVLLLGSMVGENVVGDWGQEYLHRVDHATVSMGGMAVAVFTGTGAVGRLFGDRFAQRFGRPTVVFSSGVLAVLGLALAIVANTPMGSLLGFSALGLGLSSIAPLMFSSAGRADSANSGRNIGIVNAIGYSANLVSPAVITFVVTRFGLNRLLFFPLILLVPLALVGPLLMRRAERLGSGGMPGAQAAGIVSKPVGAV